MKGYKLNIKQLERILVPWIELLRTQGSNNCWLKRIRESLGISTRYLASKIGISQPNIISLEKSEKEGTITLNSLSKLAQAMDCQLIYAVVPNESISKILENRAREVAKRRLGNVTHSMALEDQLLDKETLKEQYEDLVKDLLSEHPKHLWKADYD